MKKEGIMNNKRFIVTVAVVALAACTQMETPMENKVPVSLTYSTLEATESKAAQNLNEETFDSGEGVKVRISNTGEGSWTDYTFTTGAAGAMTAPDPGPYYPAGAQNIDIVAYYPATAGMSFTVATDQTADEAYKASDLMFASVTDQAKMSSAVNLVFSHKMAKLNVNITAGQGVGSITSVSILNVKPTVSFDQATGVVGSASGTVTSIAMSNNGAALIPAQTIEGGLLSIVTDKGTATFSVASKAFTAGKLYTLNITVNLLAVGTTTAITGWTSEGTVTVNPVTNTAPVAIDMGNGLKWANMNLGAWSETDYGDYIAWGATKPYYVAHDPYGRAMTGHWIDGKTGYDWANYPFMQSGQSDWKHITKYTFADGQTQAIWYDGNTFIGDNKRSFADYNYADDAARQNWGEGWRTPTNAEWTWLLNNCTWTWTAQSGVNGMLVRSRINGNTLFLPAAGYFDAELEGAGRYGFYWSSSLESHSDDASIGYFSSGEANMDYSARRYGQSVRPVTDV